MMTRRRPFLLVRLFFGMLSQRVWRRSALREGGTLVLVFSKDRAMQLDLLLRSWAENGLNAPRLTILWKASTDEHAESYKEVFARNAAVIGEVRGEADFKQDVIDILRQSVAARVFFLVDDLVLVGKFDFSLIENGNPYHEVISLRLGRHITYCQTHALATLPPVLTPFRRSPWLSFSWNESRGDWAMPLSVDGNIFSRKEMLKILQAVSFRAPNSMEAALGPFRIVFRIRRGLCLPRAVLCNFALNRVQAEDYHFPHGDISAASLLAAWRDGWAFDLNSVTGTVYDGCHVTIAPKLLRRK